MAPSGSSRHFRPSSIAAWMRLRKSRASPGLVARRVKLRNSVGRLAPAAIPLARSRGRKTGRNSDRCHRPNMGLAATILLAAWRGLLWLLRSSLGRARLGRVIARRFPRIVRSLASESSSGFLRLLLIASSLPSAEWTESGIRLIGGLRLGWRRHNTTHGRAQSPHVALLGR